MLMLLAGQTFESWFACFAINGDLGTLDQSASDKILNKIGSCILFGRFFRRGVSGAHIGMRGDTYLAQEPLAVLWTCIGREIDE